MVRVKRKDTSQTPEERATKIHKLEQIDEAALFYSNKEAKSYTTTSNEAIQRDLTNHALDMLHTCVDSPSILLDIGCGSGLSLEIAGRNESFVIGFDVASAMLQLALERNTCHPQLLLANASHVFPLRDGTVDAAISISAIQWLCHGKSERSTQRLTTFFSSLYGILQATGCAVLQVYPRDRNQATLLVNTALACGFKAELYTDFPHKGAGKKSFLVAQKVDAVAVSPCPLSIRFKNSCALVFWRCKARNSIVDKHIERLEQEHVDLGYNLFRKSRRAKQNQVDLENNIVLHPKALESAKLTKYEMILVEALFDEFGETISKELLEKNGARVCDILHSVIIHP